MVTPKGSTQKKKKKKKEEESQHVIQKIPRTFIKPENVGFNLQSLHYETVGSMLVSSLGESASGGTLPGQMSLKINFTNG